MWGESALTSKRNSACKPSRARWKSHGTTKPELRMRRKANETTLTDIVRCYWILIWRWVSRPKGINTDLVWGLFSFADWLLLLYLENDPSPTLNCASQRLASFAAALPGSPPLFQAGVSDSRSYSQRRHIFIRFLLLFFTLKWWCLGCRKQRSLFFLASNICNPFGVKSTRLPALPKVFILPVESSSCAISVELKMISTLVHASFLLKN